MARRSPTPKQVLTQSIGFLLSKIGGLVSSRFNTALAPFGIHPGHYRLLKIIDDSGPHSQQALGEALGIAASGVVALVDDLEGKGLVERRRSTVDRRVNLLHLTPEGREVLQRATDTGLKWQDELLAPLDPSDREVLLALLQRIAEPHHLTLGGR